MNEEVLNRAQKKAIVERGIIDDMFARGSAFGKRFAGAVGNALEQLVHDGLQSEEPKDRIAANKFLVNTAIKLWEIEAGRDVGRDPLQAFGINDKTTDEIVDGKFAELADDPGQVAELLARASEEAPKKPVPSSH